MFAPFSAHAVLAIACEASSCLTGATTAIALDKNCESGTSVCYGRQRVYSCTTCKSGYERVEASTTLSGCDGKVYYYGCATGGSTACIEAAPSSCLGAASMTGLEHCTATTEYCWGGNRVATCTACADGYELTDEKLWFLECSNAYNRKVCSESTAVAIQCKMGWYLNSEKTGCIACPENTSTESGVLPGGLLATPGCGLNTDATKSGELGCYYMAHSRSLSLDGADNSCSYSDVSGTYKYTSDCYYSDITAAGGELISPLLP